MKKTFKVVVAILIIMSMMLTIGIESIVYAKSNTESQAEEPKDSEDPPKEDPVDPPKEEPPKEEPPKEEPPKEEPPKEEPVDPPKEEPPKEDPPKEEPPKEEPPKEEPPKEEPPEEEEEVEEDEEVEEEEVEEEVEEGEPSISLEVSTDKDLYEFEDTLIYKLKLINNGEAKLEDIEIIDDLNGQYSLDSLEIGEEKEVSKEFKLDSETGLEEVENNIEVIIKHGEETLSYKTEFSLDFKEYFTSYRATDNSSSARRKMTTESNYEDTIVVDKSAVRVKPGCREYEVTLDVTGELNASKPVDVVLVIDRSGSMKGSKIGSAKSAAKQFALNVLGNGNPNVNRISVVSYAKSAGIAINWSTEYADIETAIDSIETGGNTNIQDGFIKAESLISSARPNANKAIVLLSDGEANRRNYDPPRSYSSPHNKDTAAAYQKGEDLHSKANVFTIGLGLGGNAAAIDTLNKAAQAGNFYNAPSESVLNNIYGQISTQLNYSATNAVIVDKIGDKFELVVGSLPAEATYDASTKVITWNIGSIATHKQLKYKVRAVDTFEGGPAQTNEYAKISYTDINGQSIVDKDIPGPTVEVPYHIKVTLTDASLIKGDSILLGSGTDENKENYMSPISGGEGPYTYEWRIVGETEAFSSDKNPQVSPSEDTGYELTVIDSNGCKTTATMNVVVDDPKGSITITKQVQNSNDPNLEFDIFVNGPEGTQYVVSLKNGQSKTIGNLKLGSYSISEIVPMNYKLVGISNSTITLSQNNLEASATVTNKMDKASGFQDEDTRKNNFKVGVITKVDLTLPEDLEEND